MTTHLLVSKVSVSSKVICTVMAWGMAVGIIGIDVTKITILKALPQHLKCYNSIMFLYSKYCIYVINKYHEGECCI